MAKARSGSNGPGIEPLVFDEALRAPEPLKFDQNLRGLHNDPADTAPEVYRGPANAEGGLEVSRKKANVRLLCLQPAR